MLAETDFKLPGAVLLDMDGTLTKPMLDFPRIKAEMGIGSKPILEALAEMDHSRRSHAEAVLHRHEEEAAAGSKLNAGCHELLHWLRASNIPVAVVTRNSLRSATTVVERHGLSFDVLITRENGRFKPDPQPLLLACGKLGVATAEAWMVGDGQYDVEAGRAAGMKTVWISHGRVRPFASQPWQTVRDLCDLLELLRR